MKKEQTRRIWIFISAYGIVFAFLSWFHEAVLSGNAILWKGPLALLLGFILYRIFVDKV
jgi:hypothetical protein